MSGILENFFRGGRVFAWGVQGVKKDRRAAWLTVWGVGCGVFVCVGGWCFILGVGDWGLGCGFYGRLLLSFCGWLLGLVW